MRPTTIIFPKCTHLEKDCAAITNGRCIALENTDFKRPCPFYMTEEDKAKTMAECEQRLRKIGCR